MRADEARAASNYKLFCHDTALPAWVYTGSRTEGEQSGEYLLFGVGDHSRIRCRLGSLAGAVSGELPALRQDQSEAHLAGAMVLERGGEILGVEIGEVAEVIGRGVFDELF